MNTSKKRKNEVEISLIDLLFNVMSKALMIISIALIFGFLVIILGLTSSQKYNVGTSIQVTEMYSSKNDNFQPSPYNLNYFYNLLKSKEMVETAYEKVTGEKKLYTDIMARISIDLPEKSTTIDITVPKTSEPDTYTSFMETLINDTKEVYVNNNKAFIDQETRLLRDRIAYMNNTFAPGEEQTDQTKALTESIAHLHRLDSFDASLDNCITFVNHPYKDHVPSRLLSLKMFILFCCIGGFLGVCVAIIIVLSDRKTYKSSNLLNCIDEKDFIGAVPVYKNKNDINVNYFRYLLKQLPENTTNIYVSAISEGAGINTFTEGLKKAAEEAGASYNIQGCPSIKENPLKSINAKDNAMMLFILKAGEDTYDNISIVANDMERKQIETSYILNFADPSDRNTMKFNDNEKLKHIGIFRNTTSFYKKLYR